MVLEKLHVAHWLSEPTVDPEQYLFHYTGPDSLAPILENGTVQFSTLDGMNDPREKKTWVPHNLVLPADELTLEFLTYQEIVHNEPDRLLRQAARVACFTKERQAHEDAGDGTLFHRGWARARMWHTYADRHTGVCLVFDREALGPAIMDARPAADGEIAAFFEIDYRDQALDIPLKGSFSTVEEIAEAVQALTSAPGGEGAQTLRDLLFTKNTDWASEDEVRALVMLSPGEMDEVQEKTKATGTKPGPLYIDYHQALRAIVLGEECAMPEGLAEMAEARGLEATDILRATWVSGEPILALPNPRHTKATCTQRIGQNQGAAAQLSRNRCNAHSIREAWQTAAPPGT